MSKTFDKIEIKDSNGIASYHRVDGYFFTIKQDAYNILDLQYIFDCRESTEENINMRTCYIGWRSDNLNLALMSEFWDKIEQKLGEKSRITIFETGVSNLIVIKVPPFWMETDVSRGFFTLFLRASAVYYTNDLLKAFKNYKLALCILPVIEWFLDGNTKPTFGSLEYIEGRGRGIVAQFKDNIESQYKLDLVKP